MGKERKGPLSRKVDTGKKQRHPRRVGLLGKRGVLCGWRAGSEGGEEGPVRPDRAGRGAHVGPWGMGLNFAMKTRVPVALPRSSGTVLSDAFAVSNSNDKMRYLVTPNGCHLNTLNAHKAPEVRASQSSL